jgi:hypothetical protein
MKTRHLNELMLRLEKVARIGCAEIGYGELPTWYEQKNVSIGIWRDISDKWNELCEENESHSPLFIADNELGSWVLVWGEGLTTSRKSWLKDINEWAKRPTSETSETTAA